MNTRQFFSAGLEVVLHKLQLQHSWAVSREANWTHPLWNTSNLIPLERMARRKPRWLRLMFSLNSWLYSAVKSGQGTGWESKVQGSIPSTSELLSQCGPQQSSSGGSFSQAQGVSLCHSSCHPPLTGTDPKLQENQTTVS